MKKPDTLQKALRRAEAALAQSQGRILRAHRAIALANEQLAQAEAWVEYSRDALATLRKNPGTCPDCGLSPYSPRWSKVACQHPKPLTSFTSAKKEDES